MYICYVDESGTAESPGTSSHFVLAGLAVPIQHWKDCDTEIRHVMQRYDLENAEIHTAYLLRKYIEQDKIHGFASLSKVNRINEVRRLRGRTIQELKQAGKLNRHRQAKKSFSKTDSYIHLTLDQRKAFLVDIATCIAGWSFARLFAECIDKNHFDPSRTGRQIDYQAFEQVISRFQHFLQGKGRNDQTTYYGLLVHDNNPTIAKKHTKLMRKFHENGTFWTQIDNIIETPLFVDSELTIMVQLADLCSYSLRRYVERNEHELFDLVFQRADRVHGRTVGVRHFTQQPCDCKICISHNIY